jgi:uncharacterized protein (TIGR02594 family)
MKKLILLSAMVLSGCTMSLRDFIPSAVQRTPTVSETKLITAIQYIDYSERTHRAELREFTGVDPVRTEWCAAFVNAVLNESGIEGSESVSEHPLLARSFLNWGTDVDNPLPGDLVIFPRGNFGWQGHVGFYISTVVINGIDYYQILGGNQNNRVSIELYPARSALSIRRSMI